MIVDVAEITRVIVELCEKASNTFKFEERDEFLALRMETKIYNYVVREVQRRRPETARLGIKAVQVKVDTSQKDVIRINVAFIPINQVEQIFITVSI